eukprot:747119-Pyramimonas_sp.AAC.1
MAVFVNGGDPPHARGPSPAPKRRRCWNLVGNEPVANPPQESSARPFGVLGHQPRSAASLAAELS